MEKKFLKYRFIEYITEEGHQKIKETAEISMGSEISKEDELNIKELYG
jgi:RNA processing factor Prp31